MNLEDQFVTDTEAAKIMSDIEAGGVAIGYTFTCTELTEDSSVAPPASAGENSHNYSCTINGQAGHNLGLQQVAMRTDPDWAVKLKAEVQYA